MFVFYIQSSNESVFGTDFHPTDCSIIVTCGKSHLYFWSLEKGMLVKKQGLFEVWHQTVFHMFNQYHQVKRRGRFNHGGLGCALSSIYGDAVWRSNRIKRYWVCFLAFLAETREAQVCVMCDLCRKWRHHHWRFKWEHPGVGKRRVNSFIPSILSIKTFFYKNALPLSLSVSDLSITPSVRSSALLKQSTFMSDQLNLLVRLCHTGTNRISHVIQGAHEGSIFALCMLRNGTLVSGGKDRRLVSWDGSYRQTQTVEVRKVQTTLFVEQ